MALTSAVPATDVQFRLLLVRQLHQEITTLEAYFQRLLGVPATPSPAPQRPTHPGTAQTIYDLLHTNQRPWSIYELARHCKANPAVVYDACYRLQARHAIHRVRAGVYAAKEESHGQR